MNASEVVDIFNMNGTDTDKEDFKRLMNDTKITTEELSGDLVGVMKVLCGDDGDNVPSIYTWLKEGNPKEKRVTESVANKIIEKLKIADYIDIMDNAKGVKECLVELTKTTPSFDIEHRIKRQVQLVILYPELFPQDIQDTFASEIEAALNTKRTIGNDISMQMLLEGTEYVTERRNESTIFKDIDRIAIKLF
jgi:hypothetical protein